MLGCPPPAALCYNSSAVYPLQGGGHNSPSPRSTLVLKVIIEFYKKVLEKHCPPLEGLSFELYLSCRGRKSSPCSMFINEFAVNLLIPLCPLQIFFHQRRLDLFFILIGQLHIFLAGLIHFYT